jgi:hypothetical protein
MANLEWFDTSEPDVMLVELQSVFSPRKLRLVCCACMRRIWNLLADSDASRKAVEATELFADGLLPQHDLVLAATEAQNAIRQVSIAKKKNARKAAAWCASVIVEPLSIGRSVTWGAAYAREMTQAAERLAQVRLLHDVFDHMFLSDLAIPGELSWVTSNVIQHAQRAYQDRHLPSGVLDNSALAALADAMEEGGCSIQTMLTHCRSSGPHVRGCWVIDLILGKQ